MARDIRPGTPDSSQRPCEREGEVRDFGGQRVASGPCVDREGHTVEHGKYVFPKRTNPTLLWSIAGGVFLTFVLIGLYFVGTPARPNQSGSTLRTALSPAATFSGHSLAAFDCAQCHKAARNVEDVRCERCHDPSISARLSHAAHVFGGTGDIQRALAAPPVQCATCHLDHQGPDVNLADVDDRECGTCHRVDRNAGAQLTAFTRHQEFALVRAGAEVGSGLRWFNHRTHLTKVADKFQKACEGCHERPAGAASFAPISFARHCATCHEADLTDSAGTLQGPVIAALGPLPEPLRTQTDPDDPGRQTITGLKHADPWVLRTVQALRSTADPAGVAAERVTLDRQVAQLELMTNFPAATSSLVAWTGLEDFLRRTDDGAKGATSTSGSLDAALRETAGAVESFATAVGSSNDAAQRLASEAARLKQGVPSSPTRAPDATPDRGAVQALLQLIDATIARAKAAGDDGLVQRATALRARAVVAVPAAGSGASEAVATQFDALLQSLGDVPDPGVRSETARLTYLAQVAQQRGSSDIDATAFDLHRQQTLNLLDAVQRQLIKSAQSQPADARVTGLLARTGAVRQQVLSTYYGSPPDATAARSRFFRSQQLSRARIDTELDARQLRIPAPAEAPVAERETLQRRLEQLRLRLTAVATAPALRGPIPADAARTTIAALLGREAQDAEENALKKNRCTLCHELTPRGDDLAPVRAAGGSMLVNATFTHEPHMTADNRNCETCHTTIRQSIASRELNLPGVDSCRSCHAPGKQAAKATGCESCHTYHASSRTALIWKP